MLGELRPGGESGVHFTPPLPLGIADHGVSVACEACRGVLMRGEGVRGKIVLMGRVRDSKSFRILDAYQPHKEL